VQKTHLFRDEPLDATTRDFDQIHLRLQVEPKIRERLVLGTVDLTFAALVSDFRRLRLHCEDTTVLSVKDSKGRSLAFGVAKGILGIDLAQALPKGSEETVTIDYRSKPTSGLWFHAPTKEHPHIPLSVYSRMRQWAADACATYGICAAIPVLTKNRDHDRHWGARSAARNALSKLTKKQGD